MANEKRLIDANALWDEVEKSQQNNPHTNARVKLNHRQEHDHFLNMIFKAPTVDAEPVVHGRWEKRKAIVFDDEMVGYRCSKCNTTWDAETNYCPNCGAKMDGERKDNE